MMPSEHSFNNFSYLNGADSLPPSRAHTLCDENRVESGGFLTNGAVISPSPEVMPPAKHSKVVKKRPSLQSLQMTLSSSFRRKLSTSYATGESPPWTAPMPNSSTRTATVIAHNGDNNEDLLADDPFAADSGRLRTSSSPASAGFSYGYFSSIDNPSPCASSSSTPQLSRSSRSGSYSSLQSAVSTNSSSSNSQSNRSSRSLSISWDEADSETNNSILDENQEIIKVEPLHRTLPSPATPSPSTIIRRTRSRPSLRGHPTLPCLAELETRHVSSVDVPRAFSVVAKAKRKKLPFEPWDALPSQSGEVSVAEMIRSNSEPAPLHYVTSEDATATPSSPTTPTLSRFPSARIHTSLRSTTMRHTVADGSSGDFVARTTVVHARGHSIADPTPTRIAEGVGTKNLPLDEAHLSNQLLREVVAGDDDIENESDREACIISSYFSSEDDDSEDDESRKRCSGSEDDYGQVSPSLMAQSHPQTAEEVDQGNTDEDEVPLAQRIPGALKAQKSIRREVRDEKHRRRHEGKLAKDDSPGNEPFAADQLTQKLLAVQFSASVSAGHPSTPSPHPASAPVIDRTRSLPQDRPPLSSKRLASHRSRPASPTPPVPGLPPSQMHSRRPVPALPSTAGASTTVQRSLTSGARLSPNARPSAARVSDPNPPHTEYGETTVRRSNTSVSRRQYGHSRHSSVSKEPQMVTNAPPPVPPLPIEIMPQATSHSHTHGVSTTTKVQQRVFIANSQKHTTVELEESTNAAEVVDMVRRAGDLAGDGEAGGLVGKAFGDWILWEISSDIGMERPLRPFERPLDVVHSWNAEKLGNTFTLKQTPLASMLSKANIPGVAPLFCGWVQWESKKGRWSKRWMKMREGSIFLAKKENSKEEVFLCSLSTFDVYVVPPSLRSAKNKSFTFCLKSTDNAQLFEDKRDYSHTFTCEMKTGQLWFEKILIARSFVLQQERTVLFGGATRPIASTPAAEVSRRPALPPQPFITSIGPPSFAPADQPHPHSSFSHLRAIRSGNTALECGPFEPGSLLAKHVTAK